MNLWDCWSSSCFSTELAEKTYDVKFTCNYEIIVWQKFQLNPFFPNAPYLYPLKTSENVTVVKKLRNPDLHLPELINAGD